MKKRDILINLTEEITSGNVEVFIIEDSDSRKAQVYIQENLKV